MKDRDNIKNKLKYKEYEPDANRKLLLDEYGTIHIKGKITNKKGKRILNDIEYLEKLYEANNERDTINVCINSGGGDVRICLSIYYELKRASNDLKMKVCTKNFGRANGYAGIVFLAGDERLMLWGAEFVIISPYNFEKKVRTFREYRDIKDRIDSYRTKIKNIVTEITNIRECDLDIYMNKTEKYFDYETAIEKEIATGLLKDFSEDKQYSSSADIKKEILDKNQTCKSIDVNDYTMIDFKNLDLSKRI